MAVTLASATADARTFGEPGVRAAAPEVQAFDWATQRCRDDDIPDQPSRAFRDAAGKVNLINTHHTVRRKVGSTLATAAHVCTPLMFSGVSSNPAMYDDREWLATTYTIDGTTVYGLIHTEYQGWEYGPGYCLRAGEPHDDRYKCWYNAITLTTSTNGGASFSHAAPPTHYVGGPPYRYSPGIGPIGFFQPSNIVRGKDGFYYLLVHVEGYGVQPTGSCLWRTSDLSDRTAWRAWGGASFDVRFRDPYVEAYDPGEGVCAPIQGIGTLSESLTWNTYLKKWVLVGSADNADGVSGPGFYYFTSDDLLHWSTAKLLMKGELPWTYRCTDGPEFLRDPSLLDDASKSRSFDTTGQRPYLFFTRFNISFNSPTDCYQSLDRDLIRIPIELSNRQPGGPLAVLEASTHTPTTGGTVSFDASASSDPDGSIVAYMWDLDGDGTYERNTGSNPVTSKVYAAPDKVTVTVRVCDNARKATDETVVLDVSGPTLDPQPAAAPISDACPQPPGGGGTGGGGSGGGGSGGGGAGGGGSGGDGGGTSGGGDGGGGAGTAGGGGMPTGGGAPATVAPVPAPAAAPVVTPAGASLARFRLIGKPRSRRNGSLVLRVRAPSAGRLTVRALGRRAPFRRARARAARAGSIRVTLRPSRAGIARLRKRRRVRVRMRLVFAPVAAKRQRSTRVLTLRRARR